MSVKKEEKDLVAGRRAAHKVSIGVIVDDRINSDTCHRHQMGIRAENWYHYCNNTLSAASGSSANVTARNKTSLRQLM